VTAPGFAGGAVTKALKLMAEQRGATDPPWSLLPCRVFFDKNPDVSQGAIIANKRLGAVLAQIQADQQERDRQRMASPKLTLRPKERIHAAQARADAPAPS
jgi:hypothetical protein